MLFFMRKIILSLLPVLFSLAPAAAQESRFSVRLAVGLNVSSTTLEIGEHATDKKLLAPQLGLDMRYRLTPWLFLQSGISYTTKGFKIDDWFNRLGETEYAVTTTMSLGYLQIPLLVGVNIPLSPATRLYVRGGMYGAHHSILSGWVKEEKVYLGDQYREWKRTTSGYPVPLFDHGYLFGAGVEYRRFSLGVNLEHGLVNILPDLDSWYLDLSGKHYNRTLSLLLGYRF